MKVLLKTSKKIIIHCIYRHPCMHLKEFLWSLVKIFPKKTYQYKKEVILLGDFNIDLIKSNSNANASEVLGVIYSSNLLLHITSPTWLTSRSHTPIDDILSNINEECTSGNINTISDHLGQFLITPNCPYSYNCKKEIFQRNFKFLKNKTFFQI